MFFSVPVDKERRKEWCLAIGRVPGKHKTLSVKCSQFVCEDHFDLEVDMKNYTMWKIFGVRKLLLKKGVVPHKLECQREKNDVKKSEKSEQADNETYHTVKIPEIKSKNVKFRNTGSHNIEKGKNDGNRQDLNIEIKTEGKESIWVSEQEQNIKNEVEEIEDYIFTVRYDTDTGGEYLILA